AGTYRVISVTAAYYGSLGATYLADVNSAVGSYIVAKVNRLSRCQHVVFERVTFTVASSTAFVCSARCVVFAEQHRVSVFKGPHVSIYLRQGSFKAFNQQPVALFACGFAYALL